MKHKKTIDGLVAAFAEARAPQKPDYKFTQTQGVFRNVLYENLQTIGTIKLIDFGWDEYAQHFAGTLEVDSVVGPLLDSVVGPLLDVATTRVILRIGTGPVEPTQAGVQAVMDKASSLLADLRITLNAIYVRYKAPKLPPLDDYNK